MFPKGILCVLIMFFTKNSEIRQLTVVMGIINDDVEKTLNINAKKEG